MHKPSTKPTPGIAIAALVLSFLCAPIGFILGIIAYSKIKNSRGALGGDGLALAAIIMPAAMVPVVGVLSAIAIPNFIRYQLRAKASEAKVTLSAMRNAEEALFAEKGVYTASDPNPGAPPSTTKVAWEVRTCPSDCGKDNPAACNDLACANYLPSGPVYFRYACAVNTAGEAYYACAALGDLDGDGEAGAYVVGNAPDGAPDAPLPALVSGLCDSGATGGKVVECKPGQF